MMKRGYADTPQGQIHYCAHGRGAPLLLLLHETPRSARSFEPLLRLLGGKFRCFAVDTLGFGGSDPLPAKATMEGLARSTIDFLDARKIERAHVLGFHTGNKIAAAMAAGIWWDPAFSTGRKLTDAALRWQEARMIDMIQARREHRQGDHQILG